MKKYLTIALLCAAASGAQAQVQCDREAEQACETPMGSYRITLPDVTMPETGYPVLLFFHGAGGTGKRTLSNTGMVNTFLERGYAVIGPDGMKRPNSRFGPGWSFHPERPAQRDELAFTREIIADAASRYNIDPDNVMLSGFSIGGSLVWYLACQDPTLARAYTPVAGAFWRPHPVMDDCVGPVKMLHTHGWRDKTVPLEGRPLRSGDILQGDVFYGLSVMRELNECDMLRADTFDTDGNFWRRKWETCAPDTALEFAMHQGGHSVPKGWSEMAIDWFEGL